MFWKDRKARKKLEKLLFVVGIMSLVLIAGFVVAQTQGDLQNELDNLINDLSNSGYDWLIDYLGEMPADSCQYVTTIENISEEGWYKAYLTNMTGEYDTFDLRVNGAVEFDYIVDPVQLLPTASKFDIKNSAGVSVAIIDDAGNMFLKGTKFENQILSSPTLNSFVIKNSSGSVISYVNSTGSLFLQGASTADSDMSGLTTTNLEIKNSSGSLVAFFDNTGNLKLKGCVSENYASP